MGLWHGVQRIVIAAGACLLTTPLAGSTAQPPALRSSNLVTVQVARDSGASTVTLEADGPLPEPIVGVAHDPFRFYLDFPGVVPQSRGAVGGSDPNVFRVRVALYSTEPVITRVVLDLRRELPVRVDSDGRGAGRIRIFVGILAGTQSAAQAATPPSPRVPSAPPDRTTAKPPPQTPSTKPSTTATAGTSAKPPVPPGAATPPPSAPTAPPATASPPAATTPPPSVPPLQPGGSTTAAPGTPPATSAPPTPPPPENRLPASAPPLVPFKPPAGPDTSSTPTGTPPPAPGFNPLPSPPPSGPAVKSQRVNEKYKAQIEPALNRLRALRSILASIDLLKTQTPPGVPAAVDEVAAIRQAIAAVKPPPEHAATHDMLLQSCTLAQTSLKLRIASSDAGSIRNAGSAAAGALLLLDRVCIDLGCQASGPH